MKNSARFEFYEISKNTFFYRTPLVAASVDKPKILMSENFRRKRLQCIIYHHTVHEKEVGEFIAESTLVTSFKLLIHSFTKKVLHHHRFPKDFLTPFRTTLTDSIRSFPSAKKMITWRTKYTNARCANSWGNNKSLDNSSLFLLTLIITFSTGYCP